ncbi:DUF1816 domain-containing protein [Oxynema aestuarii]|jgi:hypothetical protein|uniref:DUF1816 domain-containing protein n=1 Tax=Oxynema aestuarii AP17 TaxID=2064643 RepID=A0A6H1TXD3_9CYAN|nr:DUF1816 domain-containing protein [Oxynema aestuarii AP17]RMH75047.1 MAG: DUF1816 domain-containing protein [Cyanobacteria bacterium J007]
MNEIKELLISLLNLFGLACWAEIVTEKPGCTYYFGPFFSKQDAETATKGYLEDLQQENAQGINISIKRCKPQDLTIYDELADLNPYHGSPVFSGQM